MNDDITINEIKVLLGSLKAIYNKLSDKDSGAISKLEAILDKIDPTIINFSNIRAKKELEESILKVEQLTKELRVDIETITDKYYQDSKELAQTLIGKTLKEVLNEIEKEKYSISKSLDLNEINKRVNINYIILASSTIIAFAIGYLIGTIS